MSNSQSPVQQYISNRYAVGLTPYADSLQRYGLDPRAKRVIDIGCGPGQWSFAVSKVASNAEVYGFDPNVEEVAFATEYAQNHEFDNVYFDTLGYRDLPGRFNEGSFDVLLCNGVLMYLNRSEAFEVFRYLLRPGGTIFLFHNHHLGYYLHKSALALRRFSIRELYAYGLIPICFNLSRRIFTGIDNGDTVLTVGYLRRIAAKHNIILEQIPNEPILSYKRSFLGLPYIFSLRGKSNK